MRYPLRAYGVDEEGAVEDEVAPQGHVAGHPEEGGVVPQLLLPVHLREHVIRLGEEVRHLTHVMLFVVHCWLQSGIFKIKPRQNKMDTVEKSI